MLSPVRLFWLKSNTVKFTMDEPQALGIDPEFKQVFGQIT